MKLGRLSLKRIVAMMGGTLMLLIILMKNLLFCTLKSSALVVVILLEKGVIQDFFTCAGGLPSMGGSILHKTSSLGDSISLLVVELERQFVHMYPCI